MNRIAIVFFTFWILGMFLGMYVASLQTNEIKEANYVSYLNKNVNSLYKEGELNSVTIAFCDSSYNYSIPMDTVVTYINTAHQNSNKFGFKEISAKGIMEGLAILGIVSVPALRESAYSIAKNDWRFMVVGVIGGGLWFGLGYYLTSESECDCEQAKFYAYLKNTKNLRLYSQSLPSRGVEISKASLQRIKLE